MPGRVEPFDMELILRIDGRAARMAGNLENYTVGQLETAMRWVYLAQSHVQCIPSQYGLFETFVNGCRFILRDLHWALDAELKKKTQEGEEE